LQQIREHRLMRLREDNGQSRSDPRDFITIVKSARRSLRGTTLWKNLAREGHFLLTVMQDKKIMVKGTEDELEAIARSA